MFSQIDAADLVIFAGAGVSKPEPAGLPVFDALRDAILSEIGLAEYVLAGEESPLRKAASGRTLRALSWPQEPLPDARLLKPHGSVGGRLIVTSRQLIQRLDHQWLRRLRSDVAGRRVLFIGYRGCDPDLQQVWPEVLRDAAAVQWFDCWADGQISR